MPILWKRDGVEFMNKVTGRLDSFITTLKDIFYNFSFITIPIAWLIIVFLGTIYFKLVAKVYQFAWGLPI